MPCGLPKRGSHNQESKKYDTASISTTLNYHHTPLQQRYSTLKSLSMRIINHISPITFIRPTLNIHTRLDSRLKLVPSRQAVPRMLRVVPVRCVAPIMIVVAGKLLLHSMQVVVAVCVKLGEDGVRVAGIVFGAALHVGDLVGVDPFKVAPAVHGIIGAIDRMGAGGGGEAEGGRQGQGERSEVTHSGWKEEVECW